MARGSSWVNSDATPLTVFYGRHTADDSVVGETAHRGAVVDIVFTLDAAALIAAGSSWTGTDDAPQSVTLKRGTRVLSFDVTILEAFDAFTAVVIGGYSASGTVDDADGFMTAGGRGLLTNWDAEGSSFAGDGAYIAPNSTDTTGTVGHTSNSDIVVSYVWTGAAPTVGKAQITIRVIEPRVTESDLTVAN
jgi:hypothetical protein